MEFYFDFITPSNWAHAYQPRKNVSPAYNNHISFGDHVSDMWLVEIDLALFAWN